MKKLVLFKNLFICACFGLSFFSSVAFSQTRPPVIEVTGKCEKEIEANIMNLRIEIWAKLSSATAVRDRVNKLTQKVREALENSKVTKEDLKTLYYNVYPDYTYDSNAKASKITGYSANHSLMLEIKNLDNAGKVMDQIIEVTAKEKVNESGVNINGITWDSTKKSDAENDCLSNAIKTTRERAQVLAKAAGVKIKGVNLITNRQIYSANEMQTDNATAMMKTLGANRSSVETKLSAAKIPINVEVSVEYLIDN